MTGLRDKLKSVPLFVLVPQGDHSWYVNSLKDFALRYGSYIIEDVIGTIKRRLEIDTTRMVIGGLSTGGDGALNISLRHPGLFKIATSFSGAILYPCFLGDRLLQPVSVSSFVLVHPSKNKKPRFSFEKRGGRTRGQLDLLD